MSDAFSAKFLASTLFAFMIVTFTLIAFSPTPELASGAVIVPPDDDLMLVHPPVEASAFIVLDDDGNVLEGGSADEAVAVGSLAKMMTASIADDYPADMEISISDYTGAIGGATCGLEPGDTTTLGELIEGMLVAGGNDAAYSIASAIGREMLVSEQSHYEYYEDEWGDVWEEWVQATPDEASCIARFVEEMNSRTAQYDLGGTWFANPSGQDADDPSLPESRSTARDCATLAGILYSSPSAWSFARESSGELVVLRDGEEVALPLLNTNPLINDMPGLEIAGKTSMSYESLGCFAATAWIDGKRYRVAVLGSRSKDAAVSSSGRLLAWAALGKDV